MESPLPIDDTLLISRERRPGPDMVWTRPASRSFEGGHDADS